MRKWEKGKMIDFYSIRTFDEITEFHCIMPMSNIPSILTHGILSFDQVSSMVYDSIALNVVQSRREKSVPGGLRLHQYANLFFHARNPMMYLIRENRICILRIDKIICRIEGVVFTDRNAASKYVRYLSVDEVQSLDYQAIYAQDWTDVNEYAYFEKKSTKNAEVLIPRRIPENFIIGAYVKNEDGKNTLQELGFDRQIEVYAEMFFR